MVSTTPAPLTVEKAEELISLMTHGLVNIKDTTGEFLLVLKDGTIIDTKGWAGWEWTHGIALTALYQHAALFPDTPAGKRSIETALEWFRLQYRLTESKGAPKNINTMSPFYCLACMVSDGLVPESERAQWIGWLEEWSEWIVNELPRTKENGFQHITYNRPHEENLWCDTLMMSVVPLAKVGKLIKKQSYIDEAIYQFLLHVNYLQDHKTGLWYHGWEFAGGEGQKDKGHNFANAYWNRGDSWISVSIPIFLEILDLPKNDATRLFLTSVLRRQFDALIPLQDKATGLWHTLLDHPDSYVETSGSAGFISGMFMAIRDGLIPASPYLETATAGLNGMLKMVSEDGEVQNVSFGTGVAYDLDAYKKIRITSMPYGQALAMLALVSWEGLQSKV